MRNSCLSYSLALFVIFFALSILGVNAQVPGYILNTKGDTIKGLIYVNDLKMAQKVGFKKKTDEGDPFYYTPEEIKGFYTPENGVFVSKNISNSHFPDYFFRGNESSRMLYVRKIVEGNLNLYAVQLGFTPLVFLIDNDTLAPRALSPNTYSNYLQYFFNQCPRLKNNKDNYAYKEASLKQAFLTFNHCDTNAMVTSYTPPLQDMVLLGIKAGFYRGYIDRYMLQNSSLPLPFLFIPNTNQLPQSDYMIGLHFNFNRGKHFSFQPELNYVRFRLFFKDVPATFTPNPGDTSRIVQQYVHSTYHNLRIPLLFKWTFYPKKNWSPYALFGPTFSIPMLSTTKSKLVVRSSNGQSNTFEEKETKDEILLSEIGFEGGLGIRKKIYKQSSIFVETRGFYGSTIGNNYTYSSGAVQILAGFEF